MRYGACFANRDEKRGGVMKRLLLVVGVLLLAATASTTRSMAADAFGAWTNGLPSAWVEGPACDPYVDYNCAPSKASTAMALKAAAATGYCDPYVNYACLDLYLGDNPVTRFFRYYQLEWGKAVPPADPHAPLSQRPETSPYDIGANNLPYPSPPMPFMAWPYGGTQNIGASIPNADRLAVDGRDWQYSARQVDERRPHPDLRLGRARRQSQHQYRQACGQFADLVRLYAEYRAARPSRALHRAGPGRSAERSLRLGLPALRPLWRRLSLHLLVRHRHLSAYRPQLRQRLRLSDDVYGLLFSGDQRHERPHWPLHLDSGYRGAAGAQQLQLRPLADLYLG